MEERDHLGKGNICSWFYGNSHLLAKLHNGMQMGTCYHTIVYTDLIKTWCRIIPSGKKAHLTAQYVHDITFLLNVQIYISGNCRKGTKNACVKHFTTPPLP